MIRVARVAAASLIVGFAPLGLLRAQDALPTVAQVYDKYAAAVGGRDAWSKVEGRSEKGTVELGPMSGEYQRYMSSPNLMRMVMDFGVVQIDQGFDGAKGWVSQNGVAQRMPADAENTLRENKSGNATFLDPSRYTKAEVKGKEKFEGADVYRLVVTSKDGKEHSEFFDVGTGLQAGVESPSPQGNVLIVYKEYKEFEGKKIATKVVQKLPQGELVISISSVTFGAPDKSQFKAPADLK